MVDPFALVTFAIVVGMVVEVVISGLTIAQSVQSRLVAIPVNMVTARPYGAYRDWFFTLTSADRKNQVFKTLIDMVAFVSFVVPQYALILFITGAHADQILTACITVAGASPLIGRSYGLYLVWCRGMFNVPLKS